MAAMLMKDLKIMLNNRKIWAFAILVLTAVAVSAFYGDDGEPEAMVSLGITDLDGSEYSRMLIGFFKDNDVFSSYVSITEGTEEEIQELFDRGGADMWLTIPENFASDLMRIKNTSMKARIDSSDVTKSVMLTNLLEAYGDYITAVEVNVMALYDTMESDGMSKELISSKNYDISYDLIFTALGKDAFYKRIELERYQGVSLARYYLYEAVCVLILYLGLFGGMNLLSERRSGGLLRLRTTGLTIYPVITAKLLLFGAGGMAGVTGIMLADSLAGGDAFNGISFFLTLLFLMASIVLFFMLSMFYKRVQTYLLVSNMAILLSCILGGGIIPLKYLPQALVRLAYFTPNYWFTRTMVLLQEGSMDSRVAKMTLILMMVTAAAFLLTGIRRFSAGSKGEV